MNEEHMKPSCAVSAVEGWNCSCGTTNIPGRFCPECGAKKPAAPEIYTNKGIVNCSCREPVAGKPAVTETVPVKTTWDCACGQKDIKGKFCPECGAKKGD